MWHNCELLPLTSQILIYLYFNRSDNGFHEGHVMSGHSNFISSVCYMPPDETYPQGIILTGSNDSTILAFTLNSPAPIYKLEGHTENGKTFN